MAKTQTPETLTALAKSLSRHGSRALVVPDSDGPERGSPKRVLIDISGIRGFSRVKRRGRVWHIGTGSTLGEVLRDIGGENGLLRQAVSMMANPLVRNRITVLAALAPDSHYFDLATALVSLGARVRIHGARGSRVMGVDDYLLAAAAGLKAGEFPSSVEFTALEPERHVGFFRVNPGRGKPTVSASVTTRLRRNVAIDPQISVSSSTVIPLRLPLASKALTRQPLTEAQIKSAAEIAAGEMIGFAETGKEDPYERSLIEVAVSRALKRVSETPPAPAPA